MLPGCRASSDEPVIDDDTFWSDNLYNAWRFDNLYNPWRDEDADRSELRPGTANCNDGRCAAWWEVPRQPIKSVGAVQQAAAP